MKKQSTILLIAPITILLVVVLILPLLAVLLPTVFEGGAAYGTETKEYMEVLGKINGFCASMSDMVIEVVYSIPIYHKYPTDTDDMFNKGPYL